MNRAKNIASWIFILLVGAWFLYLITGYAESKWLKIDIEMSLHVEGGAPSASIIVHGAMDSIFLDEQGIAHYTYTTGIKSLKEKRKIRIFSTRATERFTITKLKISSPIMEANYSGLGLKDLFKFNPANVQERSLLPQVSPDGISWNLEQNPYDIISRKELFAPLFTRLILARILLISLLLSGIFSLIKTFIPTLQSAVFKSSWIVLGYVLISVFFLFSERTNATHEKRKLAEFPTWAETAFWSYPKKINAWYKDRFPYRTTLPVTLNYLKLKYLRQSPIPNSVAVGKKDWFFSSDWDVLEAYNGVDLYTPDELRQIKQNIEDRRDFVQGNGGEYFLMICPLKHMIYPENLPEKLLPVRSENRYMQIIEYLKTHSSVRILELYPVLMNAKEKKELYYATDTHWNQYGAYLAYRSMMEQLNYHLSDSSNRLTPLNFEFEWSVQTHGDLTEQMNLASYFTRNSATVQRSSWYAKAVVKKSYKELEFHGPPHFWYTNKEAPNKLKIQFYRDSYAVYLIPYLSETFEESSFFWTRTFHAEPIINEKPDIFIDESLARFMYFYLEDNPPAVKKGAAAFRALYP